MTAWTKGLVLSDAVNGGGMLRGIRWPSSIIFGASIGATGGFVLASGQGGVAIFQPTLDASENGAGIPTRRHF